MYKNILSILFVLMLFQLSSRCQTTNQVSFKYFLNQFPVLKPSESRINPQNSTLPRSLIKTYIEIERYPENAVSYTPIGILYSDTIFVLLLEANLAAGGYESHFYALTYDTCGLQLNSHLIGFNSLDASGGIKSVLFFLSDSLLEVNQSEIRYNEGVKNIVDSKHIYYQIGGLGFSKINKQLASEQRIFPRSSERVLRESELRLLDIQQLDIMRNEIFADHGYIFKTET